MTHLLKKLRRDLWAIAILTLGIFLTLALLTYNPNDPSFNTIGKSLQATNACGIVGSFVADLFYQGFGFGAWVFVIGLLFKFYQVITVHTSEIVGKRAFWFASLIFVSTSLLALYFPDGRFFKNQVLSGGLLGAASVRVLVAAFNPLGVQVLLWAMTVTLGLFYSEKNLKEIFDSAAALVKKPKNINLNFLRLETYPSAPQKRAPLVAREIQPSHLDPAEKKSRFPISDTLSQFFLKKNAQNSPSESKNNTYDESNDSSQDSGNSMIGVLSAANEHPMHKIGRRRVLPKVSIPKRVENWEMPKLALIEDPPVTRIKIDEKEMRRKSEVLIDKLKQFGVHGQIVAVKPGPAVTMFELKPNADVKITEVTKLTDDLALALSSESLRMIAPIPGRDVIGIETSNAQRETVYLKDILSEDQFWSEEIKLPLAMGRAANGDPKIVDLRKMPHLLVAGTTGSGKSVFTVSCIIGLLFRHSPKTMRLILIDPKQVDLAAFSEIPHLLMPPVTEPKKAVVALKWAVREMEKRYRSMKKFGARGIEGFNEIVSELKPEQIAEHEKINLAYEAQGAMKLEQYYWSPQPYIVIVVEEFGDLMAVDKQNVEQSVVRLAQMARACGIHLILAMQSPRKEVVTGLIKTNIPGRISFKVASKMDSRIILDEQGAERLLAQGDMLFLAPGLAKPARHHGPFLKEIEINGVAQFWANQAEPVFDDVALKALEGGPDGGADGDGTGSDFGTDEHDERYDEILSWASEQKEISASLIQRRFRLGYPRAARMVELFEREGVVGPANGSKPRQVLARSLKELD
ncbi:MAG: DNA translocase FtsK [Pseudobdellovibrionaceae bacterium]